MGVPCLKYIKYTEMLWYPPAKLKNGLFFFGFFFFLCKDEH